MIFDRPCSCPRSCNIDCKINAIAKIFFEYLEVFFEPEHFHDVLFRDRLRKMGHHVPAQPSDAKIVMFLKKKNCSARP